MISDLPDKASTPEESSATDPCDHPVTPVSTNSTSYLATLVEHSISLCEARCSLEEEVLKALEERENLYLDAVESAKTSLAMTRRDAVDIVTRLKVASGDIINITLPWQGEVEKGAYDTEKKSHGPTALPSTVISVVPISDYVSSPPVPTIVAPKSILTPSSPTLTSCSAIVVNHCSSAAPLVHTPVFPSPPFAAIAPEPTLGTNLPLSATCPTPTINPCTPANPSTMPPPNPNAHEHQELLQRYEENMDAAIGTENGALHWSRIPWPVLLSQFPLRPTDFSPTAAISQANLQDFVNSYSQWKQSSFRETSTVMLRDWFLILSKLQGGESKKAKPTIVRVINHLCAFALS